MHTTANGGTRVSRLGSLVATCAVIVGNAALTYVVCSWILFISYLWVTDQIANDWTDFDWQKAAWFRFFHGIACSIGLGGILLLVNRATIEVRWVPPLFAYGAVLLSVLVALSVTTCSALWFARVRPMF